MSNICNFNSCQTVCSNRPVYSSTTTCPSDPTWCGRTVCSKISDIGHLNSCHTVSSRMKIERFARESSVNAVYLICAEVLSWISRTHCESLGLAEETCAIADENFRCVPAMSKQTAQLWNWNWNWNFYGMNSGILELVPSNLRIIILFCR